LSDNPKAKNRHFYKIFHKHLIISVVNCFKITIMGSIYFVSLLFVGIGMLVSLRLKSKFNQYGAIRIRAGLTGREIALRMLQDNGIHGVKVELGQGFLSDHYNPLTKTVSLSPEVYHQASIAAAAVAAHECGHAVQHARAYPWLMLRSRLVPMVQFSSMFIQWVLLAGILLVNVFPGLLLVGIILFATTTFFSLVTLPVEFDASKRALSWLQTSGVSGSQELGQAKDALHWAAMTYVVSAVASLVTLVQYILFYLGNRDRN
jgi:Zn-dependent membrane protease YugP